MNGSHIGRESYTTNRQRKHDDREENGDEITRMATILMKISSINLVSHRTRSTSLTTMLSLYSDIHYHQRSQLKQEHPQIIFIHGCGTTSLVHALAEEHHFKVINNERPALTARPLQITEINGSQSRARAPLLKQLEQVTSHHYLSIKRCPSDTVVAPRKLDSSVPAKKKAKHDRSTITSFFTEQKKSGKTTTSTRRSKNEAVPTRSDPILVSTVQVEKASLILFDEVMSEFKMHSNLLLSSDRNADERR